MSNEEDLKEFIDTISETSDVERVARAHYISSSMLRVKSLREEAALLESQMISEEVMEFFLMLTSLTTDELQTAAKSAKGRYALLTRKTPAMIDKEEEKKEI